MESAFHRIKINWSSMVWEKRKTNKKPSIASISMRSEHSALTGHNSNNVIPMDRQGQRWYTRNSDLCAPFYKECKSFQLSKIAHFLPRFLSLPFSLALSPSIFKRALPFSPSLFFTLHSFSLLHSVSLHLFLSLLSSSLLFYPLLTIALYLALASRKKYT